MYILDKHNIVSKPNPFSICVTNIHASFPFRNSTQYIRTCCLVRLGCTEPICYLFCIFVDCIGGVEYTSNTLYCVEHIVGCVMRNVQDNFPIATIRSLRKLVLRRNLKVAMGKLSFAERVPHRTICYTPYNYDTSALEHIHCINLL